MTTWEKMYLPAIFAGMMITIKHLKRMLSGQTKVVMQYPEEKWDTHMPEHYRGAPTLVRDVAGRPGRRLLAGRPPGSGAGPPAESRARGRFRSAIWILAPAAFLQPGVSSFG